MQICNFIISIVLIKINSLNIINKYFYFIFIFIFISVKANLKVVIILIRSLGFIFLICIWHPINLVLYTQFSGQTALHLSSENGRTGIADALIAKGANVNMASADGILSIPTCVFIAL